jgi:Fe-S-cluster-containing hydrogenase component 2
MSARALQRNWMNCPMDAIMKEIGGYKAPAERCIACGTCVSSYPKESITLERKPETEHDTPPKNLIE